MGQRQPHEGAQSGNPPDIVTNMAGVLGPVSALLTEQSKIALKGLSEETDMATLYSAAQNVLIAVGKPYAPDGLSLAERLLGKGKFQQDENSTNAQRFRARVIGKSISFFYNTGYGMEGTQTHIHLVLIQREGEQPAFWLVAQTQRPDRPTSSPLSADTSELQNNYPTGTDDKWESAKDYAHSFINDMHLEKAYMKKLSAKDMVEHPEILTFFANTLVQEAGIMLAPSELGVLMRRILGKEIEGTVLSEFELEKAKREIDQWLTQIERLKSLVEPGNATSDISPLRRAA